MTRKHPKNGNPNVQIVHELTGLECCRSQSLFSTVFRDYGATLGIYQHPPIIHAVTDEGNIVIIGGAVGGDELEIDLAGRFALGIFGGELVFELGGGDVDDVFWGERTVKD